MQNFENSKNRLVLFKICFIIPSLHEIDGNDFYSFFKIQYVIQIAVYIYYHI